VRLPVQAVYAEPASVIPAGRARERPSLTGAIRLDGVSVLVVDDEADARDLIATVLRSNGAEVVTAATGAEAIALVTSRTFTVMVSDIGMPQSDGYELIARIRGAASGQGARLPAIALTAYSREEDRRRALEAGFQDHVAKPVDPETLVRLVDRLASPR
jgi:CheY-like chemotaxis protein